MIVGLKKTVSFFIAVLLLTILGSCNNSITDEGNTGTVKIVFLHHSTGKIIWAANNNKAEHYLNKIVGFFNFVPDYFEEYNSKSGTNYVIEERVFPKSKPYGWKNYPYDYYNIWVKNAGNEPFMEEPTLEILTKEYDVIIFKHCFPGSNILEDTGNPDINSGRKSIENYKLQYNALKKKMKEFPETKFIVWTIPALLENHTKRENAERAEKFYKWEVEEWDEEGDNIYLWDFRAFETDGGMFLKPEYAKSENDSHPGFLLAKKTAPFFCNRIIDIIETNGKNTTLTGESYIVIDNK